MKNNKNNINWSQVLSFQELTRFLDGNRLVELSLSNHHLRDKLSPLIFRSICLNSFSLEKYFINANGNEIYNQDYNEYMRYITCSIACKCGKSKSKHLEHDHLLKTLDSSLTRIKKYVKSFKLQQLRSFGCFAFSLVYNFNNLENLEIQSSSIYYSDIINLENLEKLKTLVLDLALIYDYNQYIEPRMINMPKTLEYISTVSCSEFKNRMSHCICDCLIIIANNSNHPIEMLFPVPIPSLKRLKFSNNKAYKDCLQTYLKLNPQLVGLELESGYITDGEAEYIATKCPNISELSIKDYLGSYEKISISTYHYIKKLNICIFESEYFTTLQKLCENFPELTHLALNIYQFKVNIREFNKFMKTTVPKFHRLSTLEIYIPYRWDWPPMYFRELKNIKKLIIRSSSPSIFELNANQLPPQRLRVMIECLNSGRELNFINKAL